MDFDDIWISVQYNSYVTRSTNLPLCTERFIAKNWRYDDTFLTPYSCRVGLNNIVCFYSKLCWKKRMLNIFTGVVRYIWIILLFTMRSFCFSAQPQVWRTTHCRLSATDYSIYSQLSYMAGDAPHLVVKNQLKRVVKRKGIIWVGGGLWHALGSWDKKRMKPFFGKVKEGEHLADLGVDGR